MPSPNPAPASCDELLRIFSECGGTDGGYLQTHYNRYAYTLREFLSTWDWRGKRLLDVGGGWLHQAVLFRLAGFEVTSAELGAMIWWQVKAAAERHGIALLPYDNLAKPDTIEALPESSFDVILFSEIVEHITFNPVRMWKALYRVLAPGGRIVVSTPSVYSLQGRLWDAKRWRHRMGVGLTVDEILLIEDTAPHWKEYSLNELQRYFRLLSTDFQIRKAIQVDGLYPEPWHGMKLRAARLVKKYVPPLRQNIHMEVELESHNVGITAKPGWIWPARDYRIP